MTSEEIERTIEFLLQHHAKFETGLERWHMESEIHWRRSQERLDRHDRQILLLGRLGRQWTRRIFDPLDALAKQQRAFPAQQDSADESCAKPILVSAADSTGKMVVTALIT